VILNIFQRCICGKHLEDVLNLFLRRFHAFRF
jgi:hypothetical protein